MNDLKVIDKRHQVSKVEGEAIDAESPNAVVLMAMQKGYSPELIEKMMELQERFEKTQARKAYHKAMAKFKANPPKVWRDIQVKYEAKGGQVQSWSHSDLGKASDSINIALGEYGLNATWRTEPQDNNILKVTCIIYHELGHSESTWLQSLPDTSGSKNAIQAVGSALFYLERYTLFAITGLAPARMDDDGNMSGGIKYVNSVQLKAISKLIKEKGFDKELFSAFMGVEKLEEIPAGKYREAIIALKERKKSQREPGSDDE